MDMPSLGQQGFVASTLTSLLQPVYRIKGSYSLSVKCLLMVSSHILYNVQTYLNDNVHISKVIIGQCTFNQTKSLFKLFSFFPFSPCSEGCLHMDLYIISFGMVFYLKSKVFSSI